MVKKGIKILAVGAVGTLLLCGCGTQMHELTSEEEQKIVQYSASVVAKYNRFQKDGISAVRVEDTETEDTQEQTESQTQESSEKPSGSQTTNPQQSQESEDAITMAEAIGYAGKLEFAYDGYTIKDYYKQGEGFAVNPSEGKKLLIMSFTMTNVSSETLEIDLMPRGTRFQLSLDGGNYIQDKDVLVSISNYQGTLAPKDAQEVLIFFEVDKQKDYEGMTPSIKSTTNGTTNSVKL